MRWKILVSAPYMLPVLDRLNKVFLQNEIEVIVPPVNERLEEEDLLPWVTEIDGAICGDDRYTEKVLDAAPNLKVISKWGTGIDSIDQQACKLRGIKVCNTPNAFSEPVADAVIGYMICFARHLPWMDRDIRKGVWHKIPGKALHECTLGVIGIGNVGKTIVRRTIGFGMKTLGNDIAKVPEDFLTETGIEMVPKEYLLQHSDFVSLNCDLNPTSHHLMTIDRFKLMKRTGVIINTARGPIIKEGDLIDALKDKLIAGAALDVFENEPLSPDNLLLSMDNVMLAPHNANSSPEAWERVHHSTIDNLIKALKVAER